MDEKPDQIMSHIESQRDQLGRNLNELETRVKGATDWRQQFNKNPMLMMGVAVGGGLLLGSMVGGSRKSNRSSWSSSSRNYSGAGAGTGAGAGMAAYGSSASSNLSPAKSSYSSSSSSPAMMSEQRRKANETLDHIKAALIGFATAKVKEFMTEALPGFNQHLDEAQRNRSQGSTQSYGMGRSSSTDYSGSYEDRQRSGGSSTESSSDMPGTTRTEHSANSPYTRQGSGQNTGMNV